jgi:hypothetical protein
VHVCAVDDDYYVGMRLCLMACSHAARTKFLILSFLLMLSRRAFSEAHSAHQQHKGMARRLEVKIESHVFAQGLIVVDAQRAHTRGKIAPRRVIFGLITIYHEARFS